MKLYDALNIRKDESLAVILFVSLSFFLGTFLGTFDVGANTLFLQVFDETMIPKAIVIFRVDRDIAHIAVLLLPK